MKSIYIVIITYNGIKWVDKCFGSLRNSDYPVKTIAVDNGSTDGTVATIRAKYPEVEVIQPGSNLGFGKGNNLGMQRALAHGADFVFLLNQDAYLFRGSLKNLLEKFVENPRAGIVSPIHLSGDERNLDFGFYKYVNPQDTPYLLASLLENEKLSFYESKFINAAAWIIRASVLKEVGLFHPVFEHYGEDREYVARLQKANYKVYVYTGLSIVHDRPQHRGNNSYFKTGEAFKRTMLLDLVTRKISPAKANLAYFKVFLDKLFKLRFKHALITVKNWRWINRKIRSKDFKKRSLSK
jgi:N-acetylglucosaminyl-diphospho-decaprenol L-rhamnosyltransferase